VRERREREGGNTNEKVRDVFEIEVECNEERDFEIS
jgi:hypothetical protein